MKAINRIEPNDCDSMWLSGHTKISIIEKISVFQKDIFCLITQGFFVQQKNIYICPLSSVQNKLRFILHEPYDLLWPLSGRSLGKNMYYCASSIYFLKMNKKSTTLSNLGFYLSWLIRSLSYIIIVPTLK